MRQRANGQTMNLEQELLLLPDLAHFGIALVQFAHSLRKGTFGKKSDAWIYSVNFVGFEVRYKRTKKLYFLVNELPRELENREILPLFPALWNFRRGEINNPRQLACAATYIEASYSIWYRNIFGDRVAPTTAERH